MFAIESPYVQFFDLNGSPLSSGSIYFGTANQNPETVPQTVFWDFAGTQPAAQPLPTLNGYIVRSGTPAVVYAAADYSVTVRNKQGALVFSAPNSAEFSLATQISQLLIDLSNTTDTSKGDALVGVKQQVTGAAATTQHAHNAHFKTGGDIGLDIAAANNATAWNAHFAGGDSDGMLYLGRGKHTFTSAISVSQPGVVIQGQGNGYVDATRGSSMSFQLATNGLHVNGANSFSLRDMRLEGVYDTVTPANSTNPMILQDGGTVGALYENLRAVNCSVWLSITNSIYTEIKKVTTANINGEAVILSVGTPGNTDQNLSVIDCGISPGSANKTTDCFKHTAGGGSHKFVGSTFTFGQYGLNIDANGGDNASFIYVQGGGGFENSDRAAIRSVGAHHWLIGGIYAAIDGDDDVMFFDTTTYSVQIGDDTYIHGGGRNGISFDGQNMTSSCNVYNIGRYANPARGLHPVTTVASGTGSRIRMTYTTDVSTLNQRAFKNGEWIVAENFTSTALNGVYKVVYVDSSNLELQVPNSSSGLASGIDNSVYAGPYTIGSGTIRALSNCYQIGPNAQSVLIDGGQLGRALDGIDNHDYTIFIESPNDVKIGQNIRQDVGTLGLVRYIPTVAPLNAYYWFDLWRQLYFTVPTATTGYRTQRVAPGVYAIVGVDCIKSGGTAIITACAHKIAGGYTESGSVSCTTSWANSKLGTAVLVRIDDIHDEIGINIASVSGSPTVQANVIYVRVA